MKNTWAWVYGDECGFLWDHFGITPSSSDDRMRIDLKFVESAEEWQEEDEDEDEDE